MQLHNASPGAGQRPFESRTELEAVAANLAPRHWPTTPAAEDLLFNGKR
jgi:hypothetical protein